MDFVQHETLPLLELLLELPLLPPPELLEEEVEEELEELLLVTHTLSELQLDPWLH